MLTYWDTTWQAAFHHTTLRGPFTQDGDRTWVTIERYKIGLISQQSLKSNEKAIYMGDPCALIDLSAIFPSGWNNLAFIERLLRDRSLGDR